MVNGSTTTITICTNRTDGKAALKYGIRLLMVQMVGLEQLGQAFPPPLPFVKK